MYKKTFLLFCCFGVCLSAGFAQDTIRLMQYNLLNYGNSANAPANKNPKLKQIVGYIQPELFGINEMAPNAIYADNILQNTLNVNGSTKFKRAAYSNTSSQSQVSLLFYHSGLFTLYKQEVISADVRDIMAYTLYYNDADLSTTHDTLFLTLIVAHFKAGDGSSEAATRASEAYTIATYLKNRKPTYFILQGDLNLYSGSEQAYQHLTANPNAAARLYDPLENPGNWASAMYANIHTQSTRTAQESDGGSNGGMDDRFDFFLCSASLLEDTSKIRLLPASYKALGQDGQHYNKALTDAPANTALPSTLINALYGMSDHLPIYADLVIQGTPLGFAVQKYLPVNVQNPVADRLHLQTNAGFRAPLGLSLYNLQGMQVWQGVIATSGSVVFDLPALSPGLYVLRLEERQGHVSHLKLVKE